jgi:hypothetical protein
MAGTFSSLKSFKDFHPPAAKIAQYEDHVADGLEPCNCKVCVMHALRFGGGYVVKKNGEWTVQTVEDDDDKIKAISNRAIYAAFLARAFDDDFFDYIIKEGIRAFPHDVSKVDGVNFGDAKKGDSKKRKAKDDAGDTPAKRPSNSAMSASEMMPAMEHPDTPAPRKGGARDDIDILDDEA